VPADAINFKPALCGKVYGDGRALFGLTTINLRPAYYVIRGDSGWDCADVHSPCGAPGFADFTDDILSDLEEDFGPGRCGYSGSSLYVPLEERTCDCEDCRDQPILADWPALDDEGGCMWWRMEWPVGFPVVPHPWTWCGNLLREDFRP
jgi:hypothetical protein